MAISDSLISELKHEVIATRKVLERVPDDRLSWKPHQKSFSFIQLASHVATIPEWVEATLNHEEMVLPENYKPWIGTSSAELVERFDKAASAAIEHLSGYPDEEMMKLWMLRDEEQVYFTLPRVAVLRSFVMNHLVHHRGQLSVYLRLNDIPVPAIYGPSADEF